MKNHCFLFAIIFFGCGVKKESTPIASSPESNFDELIRMFDLKDQPILFDSLFFEKLEKIVSGRPRISNELTQLIGVSESTERYEDQLKYFFYPLYRLKTDNCISLIYLSTTNPDIPFDATLYKIYLITYTSNGRKISDRVVGLIDLQFGEEKKIYSEFKDNSIISITIIDVKEDSNTGEIMRIVNKKTYIVSGDGEIVSK